MLCIRPASPHDAAFAAGLIQSVLPEGVAQRLFGTEAPLPLLTQMVGSRWGRLGYRQGAIAEVNGQAAGVMVGFAGREGWRLDLGFLGHLIGQQGWRAIARATTFEWDMVRSGVVEFTPDEFYVDTLAIVPELRGQGIGSALLAEAERRAIAQGLHKCSLFVTHQNSAAKRLYERTGYQEIARYETPYPVFRMVKELNV